MLALEIGNLPEVKREDPGRKFEPNASLPAAMYRPFFDLGDVDECPLTSWGPLMLYKTLNGEAGLRFHRTLTTAFRQSLLRESGFPHYPDRSPLELPSQLRSHRWADLCEHVERYPELTVEQQVRVANLLISLCFHDFVLELTSPVAEESICRSPASASLEFLRAFARYAQHLGVWEGYSPTDLERVLALSHNSPAVRFAAGCLLMVYYAKFAQDTKSARRCREVARVALRVIEPRQNSFTCSLLYSRFYRGSAMIPYREGDAKTTVTEMELSERFAREMTPATPEEKLLVRDNLFFVLESRAREALWLDDAPTALARTRQLVTIDPFDSRARIELGEALLRVGKLEKAAEQFVVAGTYGPPGTVIAHYQAGYCFERLEDYGRAYDEYMNSLRLDPYGISPLEGICRVSEHLRFPGLEDWAQNRARELRNIMKRSCELRSA